MHEISLDMAHALLARPKWVKAGHWEPRTNHGGHIFWFAEVFDEVDATIPGVTVTLEVKAAAPVDTCLHQFTLYKRVGIAKRRVYQLEVVHSEKKSHNGPDGPLYGPHEHVCELEVESVVSPEVRCDNWHGSLAYFARAAGVTFLESVESPC